MVLTVLAFAAGLGLSTLLCLIVAAVLFPYFWSEALYLGFWITFGISVILAIVAVARRVRFHERRCYGMPCWQACVLSHGSWQQMRPWSAAYMYCAAETSSPCG
ncbi:Uncharacterised protein [Mycobacteroides abscessus]|nr:Uncharacterised protein [Mycobacteroides abscessus]